MVGLLSGVAILAVVVRIYIHLHKRRKLALDDYLVLFATACLAVETGLLYHNLDMIFIEDSLAKNPLNIMLFTRGQVLNLLDNFLKWTNIWQSFAWTACYMIKLSFLAFFRMLTRDVSRRLTIYWWFVLIITLSSWIFNTVENIIICGASKSRKSLPTQHAHLKTIRANRDRTVKCFPYPAHNHAIGITATATDVLTDIMIVSIPILLLWRTQLRSTQKLRILTFLCLSIFMVGFGLARFAGALMRDSNGVLTYSLAWTTLFLHIECSTAVLMGGVTAFRNVFKQHTGDEESQQGKTPLLRYVRRIFSSGKSGKDSGDKPAGEKGPVISDQHVTRGTLRGVRTFIRRNGRERGETTVDQSHGDSTFDPLESYHNFIKQERKSDSLGTSTKRSGSTEVS
jgi:hypothetical protein